MIAGLLDTHPLLWEIAIKRSVGKLKVSADLPRTIDELGFARAAITRSQVWAGGDLPLHHRDPFDRLLIAQAQDLALPLITVDAAMSAYGVPTLW